MFHQGRQLGLASREAQLKWQMQSAPLFPLIWTRSNPVLQLVSKQVGIYKNGFHRGYLVGSGTNAAVPSAIIIAEIFNFLKLHSNLYDSLFKSCRYLDEKLLAVALIMTYSQN